MSENELYIRYGGPVFEEQDTLNMAEAVRSIMESGWLSMGPYTVKFEGLLAAVVGSQNALFVNSGSSANLLMASALLQTGRLKPSDELITTAINFPTSINPFITCGVTIRFADVTSAYTLSIDDVERLISPRTRVVLVTHIGGLSTDMPQLLELCRQKGLILLEDACDALGGTDHGKHLGTWGLMGSYSFYPSHQITTGEGGAVVTDDEELATVMRSIRAWGRVAAERPMMGMRPRIVTRAATLPTDWEQSFTFSHLGFNLKASEFQAALGVLQLERLDNFARRRRDTYNFLYESLSEFKTIELAPPDLEASPFWFPLLVQEDAPFSRHDLVAHLEAHGVETRLMLGGDLRMQPAYADLLSSEETLHQTRRVLNQSLIVGVYPGISDTQREYMVNLIVNFLTEHQ